MWHTIRLKQLTNKPHNQFYFFANMILFFKQRNTVIEYLNTILVCSKCNKFWFKRKTLDNK